MAPKAPLGTGPATSAEAPWTTSTVYSTSTYTVTSCAPTVTNCPAHSTVVVTSVVPVSTTVCPVTELVKPYYPPSSSSPAAPVKPSSSSPAAPVKQSTCSAYTTTCYVTVTVPYSNKPTYHPTGTVSYSKPYGTGSPVGPTPVSPVQFTGAASANNAGLFVAGAGALAALLV
jgi:hypothetical protein